MRLDAATDNLLQTRDLLIGHFEHQLLQLQDVRAALNETAKEAKAIAGEADKAVVAEVKPLAVGAINPMQGMTLESLFAPLNAVQHLNSTESISPASVVPEAAPYEEVEVLPAETLFDAEPIPCWQNVTPEVVGEQSNHPNGCAAVAVKSPVSQMVMNHGDLDPALEKATLDELNEALTRAFAQIASRHAHS